MPRDVKLGEGYEGDVMVTPVFPGQHVGQYNVQDGSHSLLQQEDASLGRRPRPGRGHRHGGRGFGPWGYGPVYYEPLYVEDITARRPFILDDDSDEAKAKRLEAKLRLKKLEAEAKAKGISGLSDVKVRECVGRIVSAAAVGAREAIKGVESGVLKDMNDVCNHIRRRVCAEVQDHLAMYAKAVSQAVQSALAEAKPHVEKLLAAKGGVAGLGDWKGDIASAIASGELDQLMSGVRRTQDSLIDAINARGPAIAAYQKARGLLDQATATYGPAFIQTGVGPSIPNPNVMPAAQAFTAAAEGMRFFARQVQTLLELEVVLSKVSEGLFSAGLRSEEASVNAAITQIRRFTVETDALIGSVKDYTDTKLKIIQAFKQKLTAFGVTANQSDNPRWFEAYLAAAEEVVPLPNMGGSALSGFDDLGLAPALIVLVKVIAIIAATVVAIHAINKITAALNSKAETAREVILQRERDWTAIESEMRSAGKAQVEIDSARKSWEAGTKGAVDQIPEPSGIFSGVTATILGILGIGAALKFGGAI